jgi:hypothetical protein
MVTEIIFPPDWLVMSCHMASYMLRVSEVAGQK